MIKYYVSKQDSNGYTYSIDNCIFEYSLKYDGLKEDLITYLYELQKNHNIQDEFWTRLNLTPCSRWNWCSDVVHLCDGIYLSIGRWNYVKDKYDPVFVPVVKLEVNLNKHFDKPVLSDMIQWLKVHSISCYLIKYDFALDIPVPINDVQVFGSRKERGLYKGTRYYGQRNKHGYCKIYDKKKESELDGDLTRVEHTIVYKQIPSLENIYVKKYGKTIELNIKPAQKCILNMIYKLQALGEDYTDCLYMLDKRMRWQIQELLDGSGYDQIKIDMDIVKELLEKIRKLIGFQDPVKQYFEDENGFLHITDTEIPFE